MGRKVSMAKVARVFKSATKVATTEIIPEKPVVGRVVSLKFEGVCFIGQQHGNDFRVWTNTEMSNSDKKKWFRWIAYHHDCDDPKIIRVGENVVGAFSLADSIKLIP